MADAVISESCERISDTSFLKLYEKMCYLAQDYVRHFWTDVAIRDRDFVDSMDPQEVALWIVGETGTYMCRMSRYLNEKGDDSVSLAEHLFLRYLSPNQLDNNAHYIGQNAIEAKHFFIVKKGNSPYGGSIEEITLEDACNLVLGENSPYAS